MSWRLARAALAGLAPLTGLAAVAGPAGGQEPPPPLRDIASVPHPAEYLVAVRIPGNYSRVEGLPVMFGPAFRSSGEGRTRAEATLVWRSGAALPRNRDDVGYLVLADRGFGPRGALRLGGTAHSLVEPVEDGGVGQLQASLTAFFLRLDLRDYYRRRGWSAFARWQDVPGRVRTSLTYRDEEHAFLPVIEPVAFFLGEDRWRHQPLVAEGRLRSVSGEVILEDGWERPAPGGSWKDAEGPRPAWYLAVGATAGLGGRMSVPAFASRDGPGNDSAPERVVPTPVLTGVLDARRAVPLGRRDELRLRGFLAGSLDGDPLPPQFQRALGGPESLPGFALWTADCGARASTVSAVPNGTGHGDGPLAFPAYGCDRVALFQAEYRRSFFIPLRGDGTSDEGWGWVLGVWPEPAWSLFVDAGRGWSLSPADPVHSAGGSPGLLADAGTGISMGGLSLYVAFPLAGGGRGPKLLFRLTRRL